MQQRNHITLQVTWLFQSTWVKKGRMWDPSSLGNHVSFFSLFACNSVIFRLLTERCNSFFPPRKSPAQQTSRPAYPCDGQMMCVCPRIHLNIFVYRGEEEKYASKRREPVSGEANASDSLFSSLRSTVNIAPTYWLRGRFYFSRTGSCEHSSRCREKCHFVW